MKKIKESFLHIVDVKWHLPFIIAFCFNLFILLFEFVLLDWIFKWLSSSQLEVLLSITFYINILLLVFLIGSLIYQLSKRRWLRAFITTVYSALHSEISYVILMVLVLIVSQRGCDENVNPCKCKDAKADSYLMENCKNHVESLTEEENKKWIEEQNYCDSIKGKTSTETHDGVK